MADNELALSARMRDVEKQTADHTGQLRQLSQAVRQGISLTIWQFVGFTLVMAGTLFGTLSWISTSLREENRLLQRQIEQTRVELQRQIEQSERNTNERFLHMEKRFDDLRQLILSQQKQAPPQR